jgi:hypothetical protein
MGMDGRTAPAFAGVTRRSGRCTGLKPAHDGVIFKREKSFRKATKDGPASASRDMFLVRSTVRQEQGQLTCSQGPANLWFWRHSRDGKARSLSATG